MPCLVAEPFRLAQPSVSTLRPCKPRQTHAPPVTNDPQVLRCGLSDATPWLKDARSARSVTNQYAQPTSTHIKHMLPPISNDPEVLRSGHCKALFLEWGELDRVGLEAGPAARHRAGGSEEYLRLSVPENGEQFPNIAQKPCFATQP
jgi:hypothetical protein